MDIALSHPLPRRDGLNKPYINYYLHITTMKVGINTDPMIQSNKNWTKIAYATARELENERTNETNEMTRVTAPVNSKQPY